MMRNMIRHGIRAVRDGGELDTPMLRGEAAPVPTYGQDRVVSGVAPAATPEADRELVREIARNVVKDTMAIGFPG